MGFTLMAARVDQQPIQIFDRQKASTKIGKGMWVDVTAFAIVP